jgi:hypothetical protein
MRCRLPLLMLAVLAFTALRAVGGQVCLGYAPFSSGPARASVGYEDASRLDQFRGELGYGFGHSDFGVLGYQHAAARNAERARYSSNGVDGMLGREFTVSGTSARICPIARLGYSSTSSAEAGSSFDGHGLLYDFGAAFGFNANDGPTRVVPSLAVTLSGNRSSGSLTSNGRTVNAIADGRSGIATLSLGIGRRGITIAPFINRYFGSGYTTGYWGVNAAINFGSVHR